MNWECQKQPTSGSWYDVTGFEHCSVFILPLLPSQYRGLSWSSHLVCWTPTLQEFPLSLAFQRVPCGNLTIWLLKVVIFQCYAETLHSPDGLRESCPEQDLCQAQGLASSVRLALWIWEATFIGLIWSKSRIDRTLREMRRMGTPRKLSWHINGLIRVYGRYDGSIHGGFCINKQTSPWGHHPASMWWISSIPSWTHIILYLFGHCYKVKMAGNTGFAKNLGVYARRPETTLTLSYFIQMQRHD